MTKELAKRIYKVGVFAEIPVLDLPATVKTVRALVQGDIRGIILPWQEGAAFKEIRDQFADLLIGVQGPQASQALRCGADFMVGENAPCFKRAGKSLLCADTQKVLADFYTVSFQDIKNANWEAVTHNARVAVEEMLGFELRHVGINNPDAQTSEAVAGRFDHLFHFPKTDKGGAFFAGLFIESMKKPFYGTHGHIAIATNCADRAAYYLEQRGGVFNWESAGYNEDGSLRVVYLKDEIGGFAVHILQK